MTVAQTDDLEPTWSLPGTSVAFQRESMLELRRYADEGFAGRHALGELLLALAYHHLSLSYEDMARASLLTVAEVKEIIQERLSHKERCDREAALARVARHSVLAN